MALLRTALESEEQEQYMRERFVFLGGTINGSTWRERLIEQLTVPFFNPVVEEWTEEDVLRENQAKAAAAVRLYVITPKQLGFYSIAEVTVDVCDITRKCKVMLVFLNEDDGVTFDEHQQSSAQTTADLLRQFPNLDILETLEDAAKYLNSYLAKEETA